MKAKTVHITALGKPRMTQQDKWKKRPCVMRYRAFADEMRLRVGVIPVEAVSVTLAVFLPMAESWSDKKKAALKGMPHRQKPDIDNICKAVLDALMKDDSGIAYIHAVKRWDDGDGARVVIGWSDEVQV